jgi:hypothetical protein
MPLAASRSLSLFGQRDATSGFFMRIPQRCERGYIPRIAPFTRNLMSQKNPGREWLVAELKQAS